LKRNISIIDVLLPKTKQLLLSAILLQPVRSWYLSELARELKVPPSSLQRELAQFVNSGIINKRKDGNRVYFQADRTCPIFQELSKILSKTVGLADVVRKLLIPLKPKIDLAFIYGSIATNEEHSSSDLDLMIIGKANLADLATYLRKLEEQLGRNVSPTVYTCSEFLKKIKERNHFLSSVLKTELLFIFGSSNDLAELTKRTKG